MDNTSMHMFSLFFCLQQNGYVSIQKKHNKISLKSLCYKIELPKRKRLFYTRINGFL